MADEQEKMNMKRAIDLLINYGAIELEFSERGWTCLTNIMEPYNSRGLPIFLMDKFLYRGISISRKPRYSAFNPAIGDSNYYLDAMEKNRAAQEIAKCLRKLQ